MPKSEISNLIPNDTLDIAVNGRILRFDKNEFCCTQNSFTIIFLSKNVYQ